MTHDEFEYKAGILRAKALTTAQSFGLGDEAEDVAQDVMLKLWCIHESLPPDDTLERLAVVAARHICIDRWRAARQQQTMPASHINSQLMEQALTQPADANQHQELEVREQEEWLLRLIDRLPTTNGIILRMRQIERRELDEIARLLGITKASVSTLLSRARRQLTEQLRTFEEKGNL